MKLKRSGKAGISWPIQERSSDPVLEFFPQNSNLSWHYNWNKNYDSLLPETKPGLTIDAEFVPMIFAPDYLDNGVELQDGHRLVLGFNEPDHHDASVAVQTSVETAVEAWIRLARDRKPGVKLASPAVAHDIQWLETFFKLIPPDTKPDYLAIHVYTTTFVNLQERVEVYWKTFHLPIIITEFAMTSFSGAPPPRDVQQVHDFMGQATKWLDETVYIYRYAWFGACRNPANLHGVHPLNRLMDDDGRLTPLGHQYVSCGHA
ncbi:hypothetical protein BD324DRAFT_634526 [Kockovaella imperatae]|uniref:Asl1-like glycosyl hydrolase catalytic domain-containing protein n=1 Tax=Kockovaella imperatae TaxID=4999 RepID=A0A1Y1U9J1_9TREE|nr:hypothetical protein BD324DRAFT_634526 [Kockovaella imperatae]ORX34699.1 hypothetical protein BD324DRAFT_634526 [Kockovaella imperatae]